jgi:hypothetical protein
MRVSKKAVELFANFCKENMKYWTVDSSNKEINNEKIILVDLMLKGGNLLIRPIMLAKFLQQYYGYKIVGLTGTTDLIRGITPTELSATVQILARSYDITEFISVDTPANEDFSIRVSMQDKYSELSAFDLAEEIEGWGEDAAKERILSWRSHNGAHIGHHILNTAERAVHSPQFEVYRKVLPRIIKETLYLHNYFDALFCRYDVGAAIVTHSGYNTWGLLGEIALQNGAILFHTRHDSDLSVTVLRKPPDEAETLGTSARRAETSIYHDYVWPNRAKLHATTQKVIDYVTAGDHLSPSWWVKNPENREDRPFDRRSVMRRLGWTEDRPVYSILNHAMTDEVYSDIQVFKDCHDWLRQTLAFAAEDDSRYWLVKRHPHDPVYDDTDTFHQLARKYHGLPHIRFIVDDLTKAELFEVTSLALTIRGSLGFDLAAAGVPVILSGRSRMSDIGFASVADDIDSYFALLRKPLEELAITKEQVERARLYIMYHRLILQVPSGFLPSLNVCTSSGMWADLTKRLVTANVETDNFYRNMVRCLDLGFPWICNIEFLQLVNDSQAFLPRDADREKVHA